MGWGRTSNEATIRGRHNYDILQQLRLNVLGGGECKRKYPAYNFIDESKQICAGGVQGLAIFEAISYGKMLERFCPGLLRILK